MNIYGSRHLLTDWKIFVLGCIVFFVLKNPDYTQVAIILTVVFIIVYSIINYFVKSYMMTNCINLVENRFIVNYNRILNSNVNVTYNKGESIVVIENNYKNSIKKMFSIMAKKNNISKIWYRICQTFDDKTNFQNLLSLASLYTDVDVIKIGEDKKNKAKITNSPQIVNFDDIKPDSFGLSSNNAKPSNDSTFVDINNITPNVDNLNTHNSGPNSKDLTNLNLLIQSHAKININIATPEDIALLPGINIVMAKKVVQYRDLNGDYKSMEDILKVISLKQHFIKKINNIIVFDKVTKELPDVDNERIIDF